MEETWNKPRQTPVATRQSLEPRHGSNACLPTFPHRKLDIMNHDRSDHDPNHTHKKIGQCNISQAQYAVLPLADFTSLLLPRG